MKNYRYIGILLVLVIMAAVSLAGCTSTSSPSTTATPASTGAVTATATATTSSGGALSTLGSAIDLSKVHWYEYQWTGSTAGTTKMRVDFGVSYNGQKADKATMTTDTTQGGATTTTVIEVYTNPTSHSSLGGHMTTSQNGQVINQMDLPASSGSSGSTGTAGSSNLLETNAGASLTSAGADTVTVPAGTYTATKYTVKNTDGSSGTVWVASGVPVPVKYEGTAAGTTIDMELTGWG